MTRIKNFTLPKLLTDNKVVAMACLCTMLAILTTWAIVSAQTTRPHASFEAEAGTLSGAAAIKNNSGASGGSYVEFTTPSDSWQPAYPGQPRPGTVLWGTSLQGNSDPYQKHEQPTGTRVSIRRTFQPSWSSSRRIQMANIARDDLAAGRVPWVSIKPPSWAAMAAGQHDSEIDHMLTLLDDLNGPVWLTIHHEPDGGGGNNFPDDPAGPAGHLAMNRRIRQRMNALGTDNIALAPILMTYTWSAASAPPPPQFNHRVPDLWWEDGLYDFMGVDHYRETGTLLTSRWDDVLAWGHSKGVDINVGEWGLHDSPGAAQYMRDWHQAAIDSHNTPGKARVSGLSYFDSDNGPVGGWTLVGIRLTTFHELLQHPATARWGDIQ